MPRCAAWSFAIASTARRWRASSGDKAEARFAGAGNPLRVQLSPSPARH